MSTTPDRSRTPPILAWILHILTVLLMLTTLITLGTLTGWALFNAFLEEPTRELVNTMETDLAPYLH